tara:strand:+ start:1779 stop:2732 length:954 start_codon:yes stop_codon:yes gene_type:complete
MKKDYKIIFFGTPDFAVTSLDAICSKFIVDCIVTSPDRKSGRGQKLNESDVKKYAQKNSIRILQPSILSDKKFITIIEDIKPDLIIVVAFRKLPKEIFTIPKYGTINLHASLLPNYRGAAPINWSIMNNENETGVTTFFINEKIDQGDILLQKRIPIRDEDNFGLLYNKLSKIGAELIVKTIDGVLNDNLKASKQQIDGEIKLAPKLNSENTRINWNKSIIEIIGQIKGLSPKPGAWTIIKNGNTKIRMKIIKAEEKINQKLKQTTAGKLVVENNELLISNPSGTLNCKVIQIENKREMTAKELINGFKFHQNSHVY